MYRSVQYKNLWVIYVYSNTSLGHEIGASNNYIFNLIALTLNSRPSYILSCIRYLVHHKNLKPMERVE
jgi:hypothetical protein